MGNRIDPWGSASVKDYARLEKEFGIERFSKLLPKIKDPLLTMKRGIVFGHRDFGKVIEAMNRGKKFVMLTGLMPSGKFHLGHKMVADEIIYLQKHGARTYLLVADIEAYNMRGKSLDELRKTAIEEYLVNYIALGLKPKHCDFYFQSSRSSDAEKSNAYYRLIGMVSKRATFNEMKAIYGELTPSKIMSVFTQVADILHPQLPEFEGRCPVVVPVGVDQDPHIKLTRDIASRLKGNNEFDFMPPSSFYHEFMPGLKGVDTKMSSSDPYSYIALTDSPAEARKKVMKYAFSGGGNSLEEHRKNGGNTKVDVPYRMLYYMFEPDDNKLAKIKKEYESGNMLTGELKQILVDKLTYFLERHHDAREKAKDKVSEFLGN
ncbi:MAG: tryptophan--tRNA ligase [Candidatus Aenigmatarchaeota archaeon]|nr:MAG: tryptophan--tRNA ligase [Candidatus Aenigmarchaeota archaeon]